MTETGQRTRRAKRNPNLGMVSRRVNAGLSREMLGYRAGVGRETIRLVESGWVPTPRVQFAIAKALDCTPLDLWPIELQLRVGKRKPQPRTAAES